ncbi:hypothetical protein GW17_00042799 [Ensete ventricosum]|nr:hypothetical protein GW17_00042799 [Ensete ventricosum]
MEPRTSLQKGLLLMIEPMEDEDNETSEEALEPKEEAMEEESQSANYAVHALAGYSNPLMIAPTKEPKLEDTTLKSKENDTPQLATHTVPTLAGYTNLQKLKIEGFLEQQSVIILIDAESIHNFMSNCFLQPQKVEDKRVVQEMTETWIIRPC